MICWWWEKDNWQATAEWRRLRRACLARDLYRCARCGLHDPGGRRLTAHHITPRDQGGGPQLGNLLTLCGACHDAVEKEGLRSVAAIIGFDQAGDPQLPPTWQGAIYGGQEVKDPGGLGDPELVAWVKHLLAENSRLYHENYTLWHRVAELGDLVARLRQAGRGQGPTRRAAKRETGPAPQAAQATRPARLEPEPWLSCAHWQEGLKVDTGPNFASCRRRDWISPRWAAGWWPLRGDGDRRPLNEVCPVCGWYKPKE